MQVLQKFLFWAETQTSEKLHALHSNTGGEYMAASVKDILNQRGIEDLLTMPRTPQQNRKVEQFNCTIIDKAMSMVTYCWTIQWFLGVCNQYSNPCLQLYSHLFP
jgi:hypothetical protein